MGNFWWPARASQPSKRWPFGDPPMIDCLRPSSGFELMDLEMDLEIPSPSCVRNNQRQKFPSPCVHHHFIMILSGIFRYFICLLASTPLKNMKVSWDYDSRYMEKHKMFQTTSHEISWALECSSFPLSIPTWRGSRAMEHHLEAKPPPRDPMDGTRGYEKPGIWEINGNCGKPTLNDDWESEDSEKIRIRCAFFSMI